MGVARPHLRLSEIPTPLSPQTKYDFIMVSMTFEANEKAII